MKAPVVFTLMDNGEIMENLEFFKGVRPCMMDFGGFGVLVTTKGAGLYISPTNMEQLRNPNHPTNAILANYKYDNHEAGVTDMQRICALMIEEEKDIIL